MIVKNLISILIVSVPLLYSCSINKKYIDIDIKAEERIGKNEGTENEILGQVRYIAADIEANIYTMDYAFKKVKKFNKNGTFVQTYGFGEGRGPGEFLEPRFIELDSNCNMYVSDYRMRRITVFNRGGDVVKIVNFKFIPTDIVAFNMSEVFLIGNPLTYEGDLIRKYDFNKKVIIEPTNTFCKRYDGDDKDIILEYGDAGGICKSAEDDKIYYAAFYPNIVKCFTRDGKLEYELSREVEFYKPPKLVKPITHLIKSYAGSFDLAVIQGKYIVNLIYETREDLERDVMYMDIWSIKNHNYEGIYELTEKTPFGFNIISDNHGYLYTSLVEPYPHVQKYSLRIQ